MVQRQNGTAFIKTVEEIFRNMYSPSRATGQCFILTQMNFNGELASAYFSHWYEKLHKITNLKICLCVTKVGPTNWRIVYMDCLCEVRNVLIIFFVTMTLQILVHVCQTSMYNVYQTSMYNKCIFYFNFFKLKVFYISLNFHVFMFQILYSTQGRNQDNC